VEQFTTPENVQNSKDDMYRLLEIEVGGPFLFQRTIEIHVPLKQHKINM